MNHAKKSFSTEILAGATISVVQYLAPLRYVSYASEGTVAHVKPFVNALVSIYKLTVPRNDERSSIDLAKTVQNVLRRNATLHTFSILNPSNSYAQVMTTVWSILQAMKKMTVLLPLNVRLGLLCVVTKTIDEE
jgi:hypothetical protein